MGPVQLLEQHHPRELVWQGDRAQREAAVDPVEIEPVGAPDDEAQIESGLPALLQEPAEADRVDGLAFAIEQRREGPLREPSDYVLVLAHLHQLQSNVPRQQLLVVLDVVGERGAQAADGDDDNPHDRRY